jgi:hypothetical protein
VTDREWKQEAETAVAGPGLPFRVVAAWVEAVSFTCCADYADQRTGAQRHVKVSHQQFATPAARRAEVVRQLQPK